MDDGKQYVDLSEKVTATYYDEEHEEWSERTVTIQDVLDSACYGYTVEPYENPQMICVANVTLTDEQVKEAFEKAKMEILTLQPDLQPTCNKVATDCISRQAAIDAIEKMQIPIMRSEFPEEQFVFMGMSEALSAIKELPSAQPEIIRCKECADYDTSWIPHSVPDRYYCPTMDSFMPEDGFCSFAERRTDG